MTSEKICFDWEFLEFSDEWVIREPNGLIVCDLIKDKHTNKWSCCFYPSILITISELESPDELLDFGRQQVIDAGYRIINLKYKNFT